MEDNKPVIIRTTPLTIEEIALELTKLNIEARKRLMSFPEGEGISTLYSMYHNLISEAKKK